MTSDLLKKVLQIFDTILHLPVILDYYYLYSLSMTVHHL